METTTAKPLQRDSALAGIAASGCGLDFECICTDQTYLLTLQGVVGANCSAADAESRSSSSNPPLWPGSFCLGVSAIFKSRAAVRFG